VRSLIICVSLSVFGCQGQIETLDKAPETVLAELPIDETDEGSPGLSQDTGDAPADSPDLEESTEVLVGLDLELTFESRDDGALVCAKRVAVTGSPFTGECEGCDFAFTIEGTLTEDNSASGCYVPDYKLLVTDGTLHTMMLAHADTLDVDNWGTMSSYSDALFVSYYREDTTGSTGPIVKVLSHADAPDLERTVVIDEVSLTWGIEVEGAYNGDDELLDFCASDYSSSWADHTPTGAAVRTESMPCDGTKADIWTIDLDVAMSLDIAVDTVDLSTAFDPKFYVIGPDECVDYAADDNFECTFPPPSFECPAIAAELGAGRHQIVVTAFPNKCTEGAEMGEYALLIGGETPVRPYLAENDIFRYEQIPTEELYTGTGVLIYE